MVDATKFPHESMRDEQKRAIEWLNKSDKKYLVLELPTGVGKSALGYAVCESSAGGGYYLVATNQLCSQVVDQYKCLTIKGRAHYKCAKNGYATSCETGPCLADKKLIGQCINDGTCDYYCLRERIKKQKTFLTNDAFFLRCSQCADWLTQRDVIVFDEAHDLESQLVSMALIDLDIREFVEEFYSYEELTEEISALIAAAPLDEKKTTPERTHEWMRNVHALVVEPKWEKVKAQMEEMSALFGDKTMLKKLIDLHQKQYLKLDKLRERGLVFMETKADDWLYEYKDGAVKATPLDVSWVFGKFLEPLGKRFVFMSATIVDHVNFSRQLGLPIDQVDFFSCDSPFPPDKSPIYALPTVETNYEALQKKETMDSIVESVKFFMDRHENEKGIVHCGNMKIASAIKHGLKSKRLLVRLDDDTNSVILERHKKSNAPTVLVSSSMLEGVDLYDDLSRWQLIVKMPWLSLGDKRVKRLSETRNDWYLWTMILKLVQSAGRSTRSETDRSITYVIDKSFPFWFKKAKEKGWFQPQFLKRVKFKN